MGIKLGQFNVLVSPFEQASFQADKRLLLDTIWTKMNKTHMMQVRDNVVGR